MNALGIQNGGKCAPTKQVTALLSSSGIPTRIIFFNHLFIFVLLQIGCHPVADSPSCNVSEKSEPPLGVSEMSALALSGYKSSAVLSLAFTDNRHLCSVSDNGIVKVFDIHASSEEAYSFHVNNRVVGMDYLPSTNKLVTADISALYASDLFGRPQANDSVSFPSYQFLAFSNGIAIFNEPDKGILLVNLISKRTRSIPSPDGDLDGINTAICSPKGNLLIAGGAVGILRQWDLGEQGIKVRWNYEINCPIYGLAVSPDGNTIGVAASDKIVRLLNVRDGSVIKKLNIASEGVDQHLLYSNDGMMLISIEPVGDNCQPSLIRFWDVKKGLEICPPFVGHKHRIKSCCLSPDNSFLATGSLDGSILIWKVPTLQKKRRQGS